MVVGLGCFVCPEFRMGALRVWALLEAGLVSAGAAVRLAAGRATALVGAASGAARLGSLLERSLERLVGAGLAAPLVEGLPR